MMADNRGSKIHFKSAHFAPVCMVALFFFVGAGLWLCECVSAAVLTCQSLPNLARYGIGEEEGVSHTKDEMINECKRFG